MCRVRFSLSPSVAVVVLDRGLTSTTALSGRGLRAWRGARFRRTRLPVSERKRRAKIKLKEKCITLRMQKCIASTMMWPHRRQCEW
jgi:hypothetical protein